MYSNIEVYRKLNTYLTNPRYMCIVPCVIINQYSSIRHSCYLIPIIPPRHHLGILKYIDSVLTLKNLHSKETTRVYLNYKLNKSRTVTFQGDIPRSTTKLSEMGQFDIDHKICNWYIDEWNHIMSQSGIDTSIHLARF